VALREGQRPSYENAYAELLRRKGQEHELAFLETLRDTSRTVVEVRLGASRDFEAGTQRTADAMRAGADYVYQAVFFSNGWRGIADFLERVDRPSALGAWSYQVLDTKLARHPRPEHALQLSFYSQALEEVQGLGPERPTSSSAPASASPCGWSTSRPTTVACASALDPQRPLDRTRGPTPVTIARSATFADSARIDWSRRITSSGSRASTAIR